MSAAAASLVVIAGCGEQGFPPAAEPAVSPPLTREPAGRSFAVGRDPEGLVIDGRTGIAGAITRDPSALTLVDLDRRRVLDRVPLPATGRHLSLARPGGPIVVPIEQTDELIEVSLRGGGVRSIAVGDHPHDAVVAGRRTFVGDEFSDRITVVADGRATASLDAPEQPGGLAAAAGQVVVVAVAERVLAVFDARTLEQVAELDAGAGPTHVVAAGSRAWVADTDGDAVLGYELGAEPRATATYAVAGAPYGIALDHRRELLWVTLTARNEVVVLDVSGRRPVEVDRFASLRQPNTIAVDPRDGSAVIAGRSAGRLQLIEAPR